MFHQWKRLWCKGLPLTQQYHIPLDKETINIVADDVKAAPRQIEPTNEAAPMEQSTKLDDTILQGVNELDQKEFEDYLNGVGAWSYPR